MTSKQNIPRALQRFIVADRISNDIEILDVVQAAGLAESAETVDKRIQQVQLLSRQSPNGVRIPAEQILGPHRVVPGLERILEVIPDGRAAWDFLTFEWPFFAGEPNRPLDVLKVGKIEDAYARAIPTEKCSAACALLFDRITHLFPAYVFGPEKRNTTLYSCGGIF